MSNWIQNGVTLLAVTSTIAKPFLAQSSNVNPPKLLPHHVTASVADLGTEADWYERVLGFDRSRLLGNGADFQMYQMTTPGYRIDLVQQKGASRLRAPQPILVQGWLHVVFKTPDIDAVYKYLIDQKTDVKAIRDEHSVITRLVLHDPEGNELEIVRE